MADLNRASDATATYLYCLVRRRRAPALARAPHGLPETGRPRALDASGGLWLVAADAPLARYGAAPLERGLRNLDWVAACAVAHEAVVEHAARSAPTIPLKLFTLFATDERAVAHVRRLRPALLRVLARVAGREEWGVRVRMDAAAARRRLRERARRTTAGVTSGTRFLLVKKQERQALRAVAAGGRAQVEAAFEALAAVADDARRRPPDDVEGGDHLLLDAAFLLARDGRARFRRLARSVGTRLAREGYALTVTGPWPPYNFVGGTG